MSSLVDAIRNAAWVIKPFPGVCWLMIATVLLIVQLDQSSHNRPIMTAATCAVGETTSYDGRVRLNLTCVKEGVTKVVHVSSSQETVSILNARATAVTCTVYASGQANACVSVTQN